MVKLDDLKEYIEFLSQTDIEELEISAPQGEKICLRRSEIKSFYSNILKQKVDNHEILLTNINNIGQQSVEAQKQEIVITSPMVGKFLLSTSKDHPPFIVENVAVKKGQKVAIIETMRIFRDVISPEDGIVKKVLVEDGQYVEYGQPLIILERQ